MPDKIIAATLQVTTGNSNTEIKEVNKNLSDVKGNLKETGKEVSGTSGHFSNLKDKITTLPGPLGQAGQGVNSLSASFKALLANPVGLVILAIVGALALLYKAFTNTFEGGQKMEQVFAGIKAVTQSLIDNIGKFGSALIKAFHFDFKGAAKDIQDVGAAAAGAYSQMAKLTKEAQQLAREQADNDLDQAKRQAKLADLRAKAYDESVPIAKRKALLLELQKESEENAKADMDLARRTAENAIAQKTVEKDGAEKNYVEIQKIKADQIRGETENSNELKQIGRTVTQAEKQEQSERKEAYRKFLEERNKALAEAKAKQKVITEAGNKVIEDAERVLEKSLDRDGQLALLKKQYDARKELARKAGLDILKINEAYQFERNQLEATFQKEDDEKQAERQKTKDDFLKMMAERQMNRITADNERLKEQSREQAELDKVNAENRVASLQAVGDATNALADLIGKQTIAGKALGIATALINTYQGASEALKQKSTLPSPFDVIAKVAAVATIIATGLKTVKAITSVQVPGGGGGSAAAPSISASAPIAPTKTTTFIDQGQVNQMGNAANGGVVRAYVVTSDINNDQEKIKSINRAARLG